MCAQAISNAVPSRNNFQVRFVLDAIYVDYKDKQIKRSDIIKLGNTLLNHGVLTIEQSEWESFKKIKKVNILSEIFNAPSRLQETFTTRNVCMKWIYDLSRADHQKFLQKETECILERLCDERAAYRVSEQWCRGNNFKTEDSSDVLDNICKALRKSDKEFVTKCIIDELKQREEEFDKFKQKEWISAAIHSQKAITWNPLLFDVCATKFNTVIPIITNMALPNRKFLPVISECRIYPKTNYRTPARISETTFIRKQFETYVGAVEDVFDENEMDVSKVNSENKRIHEELQEAMIENRRLLEEKEGLLLQLKTKMQKDVDAVAALERDIEDLKRRNKKLTTENTKLKTMLKDYEEARQKQDEKIEKLNKKVEENEAQGTERMNALEDMVKSLIADANKSRGSTPKGSVKYVTHK